MQVVLSLVPGGTERLVIELVRRTRTECVSAVCYLEDEGPWASDLIAEGVPVTALHRKPGFHPLLGRRLAVAARAFGADVLHCHQYSAFTYGRIAALFCASGIVFTEHGRLGDHRPSVKRRLVNPMLGRFSRGTLFSVSHHLREHMIAEGLPASRVAVIHNGIDPGPEPDTRARVSAREALGLSADDFVIGTAARLDPVKDFPMLLRALQRVRVATPGARLVILGDGPERERLTSLREELGLQLHALLPGHRADVRALLPAFDVFVNSSTSEGISLTILEGMASGLPVVATAVGGTPEIVLPGETGILVPARDPTSLAGALLRLDDDSRLRIRLGDAGRKRVMEHFTIQRMVDQYIFQYRRVTRQTL